MNFVWFFLAIILFEMLFWYFINMLLSLPGLAFFAVFMGVYESDRTWRRKVLLAPAAALAFLFGTLLTCFVFGGGLGLVALTFSQETAHPWVYFAVAGLAAFSLLDPVGRRISLEWFLAS